MQKLTLLAGALTLGLVLPGVLAGASPPAHAQNVNSGQTGGSVAFVRDAGNAGLFETQRSQHAGVRGYATQTVKDAAEMLNRVKFINQSNVAAPMPGTLSDANQAVLNRMAGLSGADFDRAYMQSQIATSDFLLLTFRAYGTNGESDTLRLYAAKAATDYETQATSARTVMGSL
jgi:putative membrane protein